MNDKLIIGVGYGANASHNMRLKSKTIVVINPNRCNDCDSIIPKRHRYCELCKYDRRMVSQNKYRGKYVKSKNK